MDTVAEIAGISDPRGLGGMLAGPRRRFPDWKFQSEEIVTNLRGKDGVKRWYPGPRLAEALRELRD